MKVFKHTEPFPHGIALVREEDKSSWPSDEMLPGLTRLPNFADNFMYSGAPIKHWDPRVHQSIHVPASLDLV